MWLDDIFNIIPTANDLICWIGSRDMEEDICDDAVGSEFVERFGRFVSIVGSV